VRDGLSEAFEQGAAVTAKVTWIPQGRSSDDGEESRPSSRRGGGGAAFGESAQQQRTRYISCTPLLGSDDQVGVWMVVMVENELVTGSLASRTAALNRYNEPQVPPTTSEYQRESDSIDSIDAISNGVGEGRAGHARFERSMSGHARGGGGKKAGSEGESAAGGVQGNGRAPLDFGGGNGGGGDYLSNGMHGGGGINGVVSGEGRFEEVRSP